jgi:phenylpyruvate tautomerase PptA (4-oxalocrotonate tautomerase family)
MPYLRITCPPLNEELRRAIAADLTEVINTLLYAPHGRLTREDLRERTTIHFTPYAPGELFIGGRSPEERGVADLTVEFSDWNMSARQRRRLAGALTPELARLWSIPASQVDGINIRFHSYPPTAFAVGGRLLSDLVPWIGQFLRRLAG